MNGYVCFWGGKQCEVHADTQYEAQQKAVNEFQKGTRRKVKGYEIAIGLADKEEVANA